jgi:hypothetical protein
VTRFPLVAVSAALGCAIACAPLDAHPEMSGTPQLTDRARHDLLTRAQLWTATDIPSMDLTQGPQGKGSFAPGATVRCDYVKHKIDGKSPKFYCADAPGDDMKVKFGQDNGEVFGEVAATRLLWALGFGADRMYPVRVICHGCPAKLASGERVDEGDDGWDDAVQKGPDVVFAYAAVERKMAGHELETVDRVGWDWAELNDVSEEAGGASKAQRDALTLLAVFLQHTDNKSQQQRFLCIDSKDEKADASSVDCAHPFLEVNDLGLTFGHANRWNRQDPGSVNLAEWSRANVWRHDTGCVAAIDKSVTGTLSDPTISEAGRAFLAGLLTQLSDAQLHDLFAVARFDQRAIPGKTGASTIDDWVRVFKLKRAQIVERSCAPARK